MGRNRQTISDFITQHTADTDVLQHVDWMLESLADEYTITKKQRDQLHQHVLDHPDLPKWHDQCHQWEQGLSEVCSDDLLDEITDWLEDQL